MAKRFGKAAEVEDVEVEEDEVEDTPAKVIAKAKAAVPKSKFAPKPAPTPADDEDEDEDEDDDEKPVKSKKEKAAPKKDTRIVTMLVDYNPKRAKSKSHAVFELYKDGMTAQAFIAAGGSTLGLDWDTKHGFIELGEEHNDDATVKSKPEPKPKVAKPKVAKPKAVAVENDEDEDEEVAVVAPKRNKR